MAQENTINPFQAPHALEDEPLGRSSLTRTGVTGLLAASAVIGAVTAPLTLFAEYFPNHFSKPSAPFSGLGLHVLLMALPAVWIGRRCRAGQGIILVAITNLISWSVYIPLVHTLSENGIRGRELWLVLIIGGTSAFLGMIVGAFALHLFGAKKAIK